MGMSMVDILLKVRRGEEVNNVDGEGEEHSSDDENLSVWSHPIPAVSEEVPNCLHLDGE